MASGTGGQIAIIRTGSLNYDVSSVIVGSMGAGWKWTNFISESIEHTLEELEEGAITGHHDAPPSHKGTDFGQGDIELEPNPNALGAFINAVMGSQASALVCDAGSTGTNSSQFAGQAVLQHTFKPRSAAHDLDTFNEPHAFMIYKDVGSAWWANGAIVSALNFNYQAGALLTSRATIMAKEMALRARTNTQSSLVSSGGRPWIWDTVSIQLSTDTDPANLAVFQGFEGLEIDVQVPHEGVVKLNGSKQYAQFQKSDFRRVALSGTGCFRTESEYVAFRQYNARYLRITATNVNSELLLGNPASEFYFTLQLDIPAFKLTSFSAPIGSPNRITSSFNGKAERPETNPSSNIAEIRLTNVTSGY
jgi:hypothetical protein